MNRDEIVDIGANIVTRACTQLLLATGQPDDQALVAALRSKLVEQRIEDTGVLTVEQARLVVNALLTDQGI